jgi:hypothetical protein
MAEHMASRFPSGEGDLQLLACEMPVPVTETLVHPLGAPTKPPSSSSHDRSISTMRRFLP